MGVSIPGENEKSLLFERNALSIHDCLAKGFPVAVMSVT